MSIYSVELEGEKNTRRKVELCFLFLSVSLIKVWREREREREIEIERESNYTASSHKPRVFQSLCTSKRLSL
jgi:hypothetical protein